MILSIHHFFIIHEIFPIHNITNTFIKFIIQVNVNGYLSFKKDCDFLLRDRFPQEFSECKVIAPFFTDIIIIDHGHVFYRLSTDSSLLKQVGVTVSSFSGTTFKPESLFIATWDRVITAANFEVSM